MTKNPSGKVSLVSIDGRLKLQFPRRWYGGNQKYLSLGLPDTDVNRLHANSLACQIELAYLTGDFDPTLAAYKPKTYEPILTAKMTIAELWREYCDYKSRSLKAKSIYYLRNTLGLHIFGCPYSEVDRALEIRGWLLDSTTPDMTRRVLQALATAFTWGQKHQLISIPINPFAGMAEDIRIDRAESTANAFTRDEKITVLAAFADSRYYSHYLPLVRFWLLTGCRPSEGIGLEWVQVTDEFKMIVFDRSIVRVCGRVVKNLKSKTNRSRKFPINEELGELLRSQIHTRTNRNALVFPALGKESINYTNFCCRAWNKTVTPAILRHTTPYSCRDTFITEQVTNGVPLAVVAKWCDNSARTIERLYLDPAAFDQIKPL